MRLIAGVDTRSSSGVQHRVDVVYTEHHFATRRRRTVIRLELTQDHLGPLAVEPQLRAMALPDANVLDQSQHVRVPTNRFPHIGNGQNRNDARPRRRPILRHASPSHRCPVRGMIGAFGWRRTDRARRSDRMARLLARKQTKAARQPVNRNRARHVSHYGDALRLDERRDDPVTRSTTRIGVGRAHPSQWFTRLTRIGFPRRFPIVQFPNVPLIIAFVAGELTRLVHGDSYRYLVSVSYLSMAIWAYEELAHGVNWFRRLLGAVFTIVLITRVAQG